MSVHPVWFLQVTLSKPPESFAAATKFVVPAHSEVMFGVAWRPKQEGNARASLTLSAGPSRPPIKTGLVLVGVCTDPSQVSRRPCLNCTSNTNMVEFPLDSTCDGGRFSLSAKFRPQIFQKLKVELKNRNSEIMNLEYHGSIAD
jgi:hypothetical protein